MQIILTPDGYVESFALTGTLDGGVEVPDFPAERLQDFLQRYTAYKLTDGALAFDADKLAADTNAAEISALRARRETECFKYINRGQLWYARLTAAQLAELGLWYLKWLDVTQTRAVPDRPAWLEEY